MYNCDCFHFDEEFGVCQFGDSGEGAGGRVGWVEVAGTDFPDDWQVGRLIVFDVPVYFDHVGKGGSGGGQGSLEVLHRLLGLAPEVAGADEVSVCVDGDLAGDEDERAGLGADDLAVAIGWWKRGGLREADFWVFGVHGC